MSLAIMLSLLVFLAALVIYFICAGFSKATVATVCRTLILSGSLAFLMAVGGQSTGCSIVSSGASHR